MFIYSSEQKSSIILWRPGIRQWITRNPGNILYCSQSVPTRATGNTLILPVVTICSLYQAYNKLCKVKLKNISNTVNK